MEFRGEFEMEFREKKVCWQTVESVCQQAFLLYKAQLKMLGLFK